MKPSDTTHEEQEERGYGRSVYAAFILIATFLIVVAAGSAQWKKNLLMHAVAIEGDKIVSHDEVLQLAQLSSQQPLFAINLATLQSALQSNAFIRHARVQREMPSTIRVSIVEREPMAMLVLSGRQDHLYVDEDGYVLPPVVSQAIYDLPAISGLDSVQMLKPGVRTTNADLLSALEILKAANTVSPEAGHLISEVRVRSGHDIVLYAFEGGTPILFGQGNAIKKMATLDAFWKKFIVGGGVHDLQYIDLRFDGQVVTLPKSAAAVKSAL
jgi:cell division protein FtsQ